MDSDNTTLVKSVSRERGNVNDKLIYFFSFKCLMCLCWILKEQDKQLWQQDLAKNTLFKILSFTNHPKPKVKKKKHLLSLPFKLIKFFNSRFENQDKKRLD